MLKKIVSFYETNVLKRTIIMWMLFQILLWVVFGISVFLHDDAWIDVGEVIANNESLPLFLFIIFNNLMICALIIFGNLFARFNIITPGLLIIIIQIISIGWVAGSNSFEVPFASVSEANMQYLKVGIWEVTAYILSFSVTISKSLNISNSLISRKWDKTRTLKDLNFNKLEITILIIAAISLVSAAIIETYSLI